MRKPSSHPPSFAALAQGYFTEHLQQQRAMSPCTVAAYRDAFVLFLQFAEQRLRRPPTAMRLTDITPALILAFLDHLEQDRGNSARTRNARLAALRAFLKFAARRDVTALHAVEQALGVPLKRFERPMIGYLTREEMLAVIGEPGPSWTSQRDHLLLRLLYNTGARVSEIIGVKRSDVVLDGAACVHLHGKGRKQRSVPLWRSTVRHIRAWLRINPGLDAAAPLLPNRGGLPDDARQRHAAACAGGEGRVSQASSAAAAPDLTSHDPPHHRHAPAAVGDARRPDRAVAGARESGHHASVRRGRPGDEGASPGTGPGTCRDASAFPRVGLAAGVPENAVVMCRTASPQSTSAKDGCRRAAPRCS
jgi:site-specific recombinase XerD